MRMRHLKIRLGSRLRPLVAPADLAAEGRAKRAPKAAVLAAEGREEQALKAGQAQKADDNPECHGNNCDAGKAHLNLAALFEQPVVVLQYSTCPWLVLTPQLETKFYTRENIDPRFLVEGPVVHNTGGHYNAIFVSKVDDQGPEEEAGAGAGAGSAATPLYPRTRAAVRKGKRSPAEGGLPGGETPDIRYLTAPHSPGPRMSLHARKEYPPLKLMPHVYEKGRGFDVLIKESAHKNSLFIFNDNKESFEAFERGQPAGIIKGGGNAIIRPYRDPSRERVMAAGIPTGRSGKGYGDEDEKAGKAVIDRSLDVIWYLLTDARKNGKPYDKLIYSADPENREALGVGIFKATMGSWVGPYIMDQLRNIVGNYNAVDE
jgi:hypothetical protein